MLETGVEHPALLESDEARLSVAFVAMSVGDNACGVGVGRGAGAVVGGGVGQVGVDGLAGGGAFVFDEDECGELDRGGGVVWAEGRVGEVVAEGVVGVAGGAADSDLHEAGRAGGVGDAGPVAPGWSAHEGSASRPWSHSSVAMPARISHGMSYWAPICS